MTWRSDVKSGVDITIFGVGYVGLVAGACFAEVGNRVRCVDIDAAKIAKLQRGELPFFEPDLAPLTQANQRAGRLSFSTDAEQAVANSSVIVIAVGTPANDDGSADMRHVLAVAETIGKCIRSDTVVIDKSTAPVGTAERVRETITAALAQRGAEVPFAVVASPEFLREGSAVQDFFKPDRIILGTEDPRAAGVARRLYEPFAPERDRILEMDERSAELTKYAANAMLAMRIGLMNEIANVADRLGANIESVQRGVGADSRIGSRYIDVGCGYGGSCLPKDVRALVQMATDAGGDAPIARQLDAANERQKRSIVDKLLDYFGGSLAGRAIALWGLAFKPNTDDMREAPSRAIIDALLTAGANVRTHDPQALDVARQLYGETPSVVLCEQRDDTLTGASALVVVTEWEEFRHPDFKAIKAALTHPVVFDGRNLYDSAMLAELGFDHVGVGLQRIAAKDG